MCSSQSGLLSTSVLRIYKVFQVSFSCFLSPIMLSFSVLFLYGWRGGVFDDEGATGGSEGPGRCGILGAWLKGMLEGHKEGLWRRV